MDNIINSYYSWLKENTITNLVGEYTEVTTPFLDRHNDCIQYYIKMNKDNTIFLTDDGYVIEDLEQSGFLFNTPKRKELLKNILLNYHLDLDNNNCITVNTSIEHFPYRKHFFIQGIMAINDLYSVNKNNISSIFLEDVSEFLDNNDIFYNDNIKITGQSGFDHNIDYLLPGLKKKNIPEKYLKVINTPNKSNTESVLFTWSDIKNMRKNKLDMYVLLNDLDRDIKNDFINAYKAYNIKPLFWSKKDDILSDLKQIV